MPTDMSRIDFKLGRSGRGRGASGNQGAIGRAAIEVAVSRNHKTQMLLHRRKIAVIVQQRVVMLDAEGAYDDVGRFADSETQLS